MDKEKTITADRFEAEDILRNIRIDARLTRIIIAFFLAAFFFFRFYLKANFSFVIPIVLITWYVVYFFNEKILAKAETVDQVQKLYLRLLLIEIFLLTIIIHYLGGIEWVGPIFYILIISLGMVILPRKKSRNLFFIVLGFFGLLVSLEFFEIIPHHHLFQEYVGLNLHLSLSYTVTTFIVIMAFVFFSSDMINSFLENLRVKRKELAVAQEEAEKAKFVLEEKVKERTNELEVMTKNLEDQVKGRTKELEKKLKDFEKMNRVMINREIKMVELKKEIENLKNNSKL